MMKLNLVFAVLICTGLSGVRAYAAAESAQMKMSGRIETLKENQIVIRSEGTRYEFPRNDLKLSKDAKVGDSVTIWYKLQAEKIEVRRNHQEAGEAEPKPQEDDRAFYPAKNQITPSHRSKNARALNQPVGM